MTNAAMIAGRYRIEGRLGVGGMSTVHLAFDQRLERYVAIELLAEHLADDPTSSLASAARRFPPPAWSIRTSSRCSISVSTRSPTSTTS